MSFLFWFVVVYVVTVVMWLITYRALRNKMPKDLYSEMFVDNRGSMGIILCAFPIINTIVMLIMIGALLKIDVVFKYFVYMIRGAIKWAVMK